MAGAGFAGIFPVAPTPLDRNDDLDGGALAHLVEFYAGSGCAGALVLGSGGEHPYFTFEERLEIVECAAKAMAGRAPLIVGMGFCGLKKAVRFVEAAQARGADAFLAALPTYYAVRFAEALEYYQALGAASSRPVLYYHYPQITGLRFTASQLGRIFSLPRIAGIKESSLNLREMRAHLAAAGGKDFSLLAGASFLLLETLTLGGSGAICPVAAVAPRLAVDCHRAWADGDRARARELQGKILDLIPLMNSLSLPAGLQKAGMRAVSRLPFSTGAGSRPRHAVIKEALRQLGHPLSARVRPPLPQITDAEQRGIEKLVKRLDLGQGGR